MKKAPPFGTGPEDLSADLNIDAGAPFSPNFHVRFPDTPALLDGYLRFTNGLADRHISVSRALLATQRANTVSVAYFGGARG
jgi:hypothetical protein